MFFSGSGSMALKLVDRATNDALLGPDLALNMEICDLLNQEPSRTKDIIKAVKKRISHKKPKIQILALTLLESLIKNCGDTVHMYVAEKDVLKEMVKIARKKKVDFRVKEKILILIDTWQEAFGGPRAKYPQYYSSYQELLRSGAVFPQRAENSVPLFTPPQTQPLQNYPPTLQNNPSNLQNRPPSLRSQFQNSEQPDPPIISNLLSYSEMQNARGIMDILNEMLNALDTGNREGLRQDVIVDLVNQCRSFKQQVVQLVNTTSDEEMLSQGLTLNDELQRVLALHDAIAAGIPIQKSFKIKSQIEPKQDSINNRSIEIKTETKPASQQLALPAPPEKSTPEKSTLEKSTPVKAEPLVDLLSGDDFLKPNKDSLALVPVDPYLTANDKNVLALSDMFADLANNNDNNNSNNNGGRRDNNDVRNVRREPTFRANRDSPHQHSPRQHLPRQQRRYQEPTFHANNSGELNKMALTVYEPQIQSNHSNSQFNNGVKNNSGPLPPAPWASQQPIQTNYQTGLQENYQMGSQTNYPTRYASQPGFATVTPQPMMARHLSLQPNAAYNNYNGYPNQQFQQFYGGQMQMPSYYVPNGTMYNNNNGNYVNVGSNYQNDVASSSSLSNHNNNVNGDYLVKQESNMAVKKEDKMFGDLVNMASFKKPIKPMSKLSTFK